MNSSFHSVFPEIPVQPLPGPAFIQQGNKNIPKSEHVSLNRIPRDCYFPRYKIEDCVSAIFYEEGITNLQGRVDPYLVSLAQIHLEDEERKRLAHFIGKFFSVINHAFDFGIQTNAESILKDLIFPDNNSDITALIFTQFAVVGSASMQILGWRFFQRFAENLFQFALPGKERVVEQIINKIFTPEFIKHLDHKLNQKLADLDLRIIADQCIAETHQEETIKAALEKFVAIFLKKMPPLTHEKRLEALSKLKASSPNQDWSWLTPNHPKFDFYIIKNLAFSKMSCITKEAGHFGIASFGNQTDFMIDFVIVLDLIRDEMFPSVKIPCEALIDPNLSQQAIYPEGENWVQALIDKMCGYVRPDTSMATEDDIKMLLCRFTKGETNPVEGTGASLFKTARKQSLKYKNKTVKKVLSQHPEFADNLKDIFPYYLAQLLKDAVENHLHKDPRAAIAITINTLDLLKNKLTQKEIEILIDEMSRYWTKLNENKAEDHLLFSIGKMLSEKYPNPEQNSLKRKLSILKLCAFLYCQAPLGDQTSNTIYPRKLEGTPSFEVCMCHGEHRYYLQLDEESPKNILFDTLKYLQVPKTPESMKTMEHVISGFLPDQAFQGPWSTPMLEDLKFFDVDIEFFEQVVYSNLTHLPPLLFFNLFFATQAQLGSDLPLNNLLVNLPFLVSKITNHSSYIFKNLANLVKTPQEKDLLKQFQEYIQSKPSLSESQLIEKWLQILSQCKAWMPFAIQCWEEWVIAVPGFNSGSRARISMQLIKDLKQFDTSFALKALQTANQKTLIPLDSQLEMFDDLVQSTMNRVEPVKIPHELIKIEKLAASLSSDISKVKLNKGLDRLKTALEKIPEQHSTTRFKNALKRLCIPEMSVDGSKVLTSVNFNETTPIITKKQPIVSLEEEPLLSPAEQLNIKVQEIESLISIDYEEARDEFFSISRKLLSLSQEKIKTLVDNLLKKFIESNSLFQAQAFVKKLGALDYYQAKTESYVALILDFLELMENSQFSRKAEIKVSLMETLLKGFANNQTPTKSPQHLMRISSQITKIVQHPYYLTKPIPETFIKSYKLAMPTLYYSLQRHGFNLECALLYDVAPILDINNPVIKDFAAEAVQTMISLCADEKPSGNVLILADRLCNTIVSNGIAKQHLQIVLIYRKLISSADSFDKMTGYLRVLETIQPLKAKEDLETLFVCFEKLCSRQEHSNALQILEFFHGKLPSSEIAKANTYHKFIGKMVKDEQWHLACEAMVLDPFIWENPSFEKKLKDYFLIILEKLLSGNKDVSQEHLKMFFKLITRFEINNLPLLSCIYERCAGTNDQELADLMCKILKEHCLPLALSENLSSDKSYCGKILSASLSALKYCTTPNLIKILDQDEMLLKACICFLPKEQWFDAYKIILKCWMQLIKSKKGNERQPLIQNFEKKAKLWEEALQIASNPAQSMQCHLQMAEFYTKLKEGVLLDQTLGHYVALTKVILDEPHKTEDSSNLLFEHYAKLTADLLPQVEKAQSHIMPSQDHLIEFVKGASKSGLPVLQRAKLTPLLAQLSVPDAITEGLMIIEEALRIESFKMNEIPVLRTFEFGALLEKAIDNLAPLNLSERCRAILSDARIGFFLNNESRIQLILRLSNHFLNLISGEKPSAETETWERGLSFVISQSGTLSKAKPELGGPCLIKCSELLADVYFKMKNTGMFSKLFQQIQETPAADALFFKFLWRGGVKLSDYVKGTDPVEKIAFDFIDLVQTAMLKAAQNKKTYSKQEISELIDLLLSLFMIGKPAYTNYAIKLIEGLQKEALLQEGYPELLCEFKLLRSVHTNEKLTGMPEIETFKKAISASVEHLMNKKKVEHRLELYTNYKYLFQIILKEITDKQCMEIVHLLDCIFISIADLEAEHQDALIDEAVKIWNDYISANSEVLFKSLFPLSLYISHNRYQNFILKCLEKKLFALLRLQISQSSSKKNKSDIINHTYGAIYRIYECYLENLSLLKPGEVSDSENLILLKELPQLYLKFYREAEAICKSYEDRANAFDYYCRILKLLVDKLESKVFITDIKFFDELFANTETFMLNMAGCPANLKKQFAAFGQITFHLKKDYKAAIERCRSKLALRVKLAKASEARDESS